MWGYYSCTTLQSEGGGAPGRFGSATLVGRRVEAIWPIDRPTGTVLSSSRGTLFAELYFLAHGNAPFPLSALPRRRHSVDHEYHQTVQRGNTSEAWQTATLQPRQHAAPFGSRLPLLIVSAGKSRLFTSIVSGAAGFMWKERRNQAPKWLSPSTCSLRRYDPTKARAVGKQPLHKYLLQTPASHQRTHQQ